MTLNVNKIVLMEVILVQCQLTISILIETNISKTRYKYLLYQSDRIPMASEPTVSPAM